MISERFCTAHEHMITEGISGLRYRLLAALRLQITRALLSFNKITFYSYPHTNNASYVSYKQNFFENTIVNLNMFIIESKTIIKSVTTNFTYVYICIKYKVISFNITNMFEEFWFTPGAGERVLIYIKVWA